LKDTFTWTVIPSSQVRVSIQNLILVSHVVEAAKLGREELWRDRGTIEAYLPRPHALLKETKSRIAEASPKPSREFYPGEKNGRFETGVGGRVIQEVCPAKKGYHIFGADQNRRRLTKNEMIGTGSSNPPIACFSTSCRSILSPALRLPAR